MFFIYFLSSSHRKVGCDSIDAPCKSIDIGSIQVRMHYGVC